MSKITAFTRQNLKELRPEIESALAALATKHGISIKLGNASFLNETATFKLELATISSSGVVASKEARDFTRYAFMYGLKPEHLNQVFTDFDGETYTVRGLMSKSRKYPVLVERQDGTQFKFPATRVSSRLS